MKIVKPRRVTHSYVQTIEGTPEVIFPLYCPVKETEWCEGWDPALVYSESGVAEPDCVFMTRDGEVESAWFVTRHEPEVGVVEMVKHTPRIAFVKLRIALAPLTDKTTRATISYSYTALGSEGDRVLEAFTEESYRVSMQAWETAMNHYLTTGELLTGLPAF